MHINTDMHHVLSPVPHIGEKNPSRKLKVPVVSVSLSVWSCWGRCHGYREQLPKTFFFFFWQVNRSKVDFFFWLPCHTNAIQQWLRSGCTAPPRFLSPQLSAGLFPGSFCFCFVPCSAISISLRPKSDCLMFLMQKSAFPFEFFCCLSRGDVSSSELSVYDAAKMRNKQIQI